MSDIETALNILADARTASLGTLSESGAPYVSLVTVAANEAGHMILLLSGLAVHTQNLQRSQECSLLISNAAAQGQDPLTAARITVTATAKRLTRAEDQKDRDVFLKRHPQAAMYADFGDFAFYALEIHQTHLVAGFGRIETYSAEQLLSFRNENSE